jgi:hypothetical protein
VTGNASSSERGTSVLQKFWVPGPLPGLNEILSAKGERWSGSKYSKWNKLKKQWHANVSAAALERGIVPMSGGVWFHYRFSEPNRRRDPSNFIAGGVKVIEDGLQDAGLLEGDGWKNVMAIMTSWEVDVDTPGVLVEMESEDD